jgi:hypothetical protein
MVVSKPTTRKPKRRKRFTGIVAAAEMLQVSRQHLYAVLTHRRVSKQLLKRYRALQQARHFDGECREAKQP